MLPLANIQIWLTPLWLFSVGVAAGVILLAALLGILWCVSREGAESAVRTVSESCFVPVVFLALSMTGLSFVAAPTMPTRQVFASLADIFSVGEQKPLKFTVEPRTEDHEEAISFRASQLQQYEILSDQDLVVNVEEGKAFTSPLLLVQGNEPLAWTPRSKTPRRFDGTVTKLYVTNESDAPAEVTFSLTTEVEMPEVHHIPWIALATAGLCLGYLALHLLFPQVATIAAATAKEAIAQPIFLLAGALCAVAMLIFIYIPYNTFGEDVKVLKMTGFEWTMTLAILVALWTASSSVADEIEGRTALTLLSKPISRRQFVLGKFTGIVLPLLMMFIVISIVLMCAVSYKVVYDARETSNPNPDWQACYGQMIRVVPGMFLAFLETVTLTAISVAISTRLSFLPNLVICGTIYVLGHLLPLIVQSSSEELEYVAFIGKLLAVVLPVLDHFNIQPAIAGGVDVPIAYLGWALLYCGIYCGATMLLALILFEDRDLA